MNDSFQRFPCLVSTIILALVSFPTISAKEPSTQKAMHKIFKSYIELLPYASNELRFKDPRSEKLIKNNLSAILSAFQTAKHSKVIQSPGMQPSLEAVEDHLKLTEASFKANNLHFARVRLKATAELCISCHTQLPDSKKGKLLSHFENVKMTNFENDYERGDFFFLLRDYPKALKFYQKEIEQRLEKNKKLKATSKSDKAFFSDFTIEASLRRILSIYTKVHYDPVRALTTLEPYLNQKQKQIYPASITRSLAEWNNSLKEWKKSPFKGNIDNGKELVQFLEKHPVDEESTDVDLLILAGVLYRFINKNPDSANIPMALYHLGKIDNFLEHSYLYSLGELYLKRCIINYSSSPFARKCFKEYEDIIEFGFTGTSGTHIPAEEQAELKRLKSFIK